MDPLTIRGMRFTNNERGLILKVWGFLGSQPGVPRPALLTPNRYGARRKMIRRWQRAGAAAYEWEKKLLGGIAVLND